VEIKTGYGPYAVTVAFLVGAANGFLLNEYYRTNKQESLDAGLRTYLTSRLIGILTCMFLFLI